MSKIFYFDLNPQKVNFSLNYLQKLIQQELTSEFELRLTLFENEFGGRFYIEKKSFRGVEVFLHDRKQFVMKLNILSNEADYLICEKMITVLVRNYELEVHEENDDIILDTEQLVKDYFLPEKINHEREIEADVIIKIILQTRNNIRFDGVNNPVYFGMGFIEQLKRENSTGAQTLALIDQTMNKVQWKLPDYRKPSPALISKKDNSKQFKIRMMFNGNDYVLNDYEYLMICDTGIDAEIIFINNEDLKRIICECQIPWQQPDDFTVVASKLKSEDWDLFVEAARKYNRQREIEEPTRFIFEVREVFHLNKCDILLGKGNLPLYRGKVHCGDIQLDITPSFGNSLERLNNLSFQLKKGSADKSLIGKIFMEMSEQSDVL